jgi:hypothetical protein
MTTSDVLMLHAVTAACADCGDERVFLPVDASGAGGFCCTTCDAAVFLVGVLDPVLHRDAGQVA